MKILLLSNDFEPAIGGVGVHVTNLAVSLKKLNHEVTVLAGDEFRAVCKDDDYVEFDYYGVKVVRFYIGKDIEIDGEKKPIYRVDTEWGIHNYQTCYIEKALKYLRNNKSQYDIIHAHHILISTAYKVIQSYLNIPMIITFHQIYLDKSMLKEALSRYHAFNCNAGICVSDEIKKSIEAHNPSLPLFMINNAVEDIDMKLSDILNKKKFRILYCGRLTKTKGVEYLIYATKILCNSKYSQLTVDIVGDGEELEYLKDLAIVLSIENNIIFHGKKSKAELKNLYLESEIVILPSEKEGFATVALEAMSYGACVVASDIPSFREMITHKKTGILVPFGNPEKLSEAISYLLNHEEVKKEIVQNAFFMVKDKFTWKNRAIEISGIYDYILRRSK